MNHVFRVVWNACAGCWQAVAESAKGQGKSGGAVRRASFPVGAAALQLKPLVLAVAAALVGTPGYAGPEGGSVARGSASISQSGTTTTINQSSDRAVINWNRFSVGANESVRFNQPSRTSATLNRVTGAERSEILGSMSANGHVFLLNPNGVLVGKGAQVNVGGFIASSLDMDDDDFMSGKINLKGESVADVTNDGDITAEEGGTVVLIAPEVNNNGTITANQGSVVLAGTSSLAQGATTPAPAATPTPAPSPAPQSAGAVGSPAPAPVESPAASVPAPASSQEAAVAAAPSAPAVPSAPATVSTEPVAPAQIASGGGNTADRFTVRLQDGSNVAFTIDQGAINAMVSNGGLIKAQGGHVILTAKGRDELSKATVNHSGVIEAQTTTTRNGVVELLADMTVGTVNLSGRIDAGAVLPTSAVSHVSATPSRQALRGGFVETSAGKVVIADSARVNTLGSAVNGIQHGNWLIDPQDFTIAANGGNISGATLAANLQSGDVTIDTQYMGTPGGNGDIFVREEIIIHGPGVVMDGVFDGVDLWYGYIWDGSAPTRLTLRADRNIVFSATPEEISEYGGTIGGGGGFIEFINGEVDLQPNARGATGGRIYVETYPFGDSSVIANNIYLSTDNLGPGLQRGSTQVDVRVQDQNQVSQVVPMSLDTLVGVSPAPAEVPVEAPAEAPAPAPAKLPNKKPANSVNPVQGSVVQEPPIVVSVAASSEGSSSAQIQASFEATMHAIDALIQEGRIDQAKSLVAYFNLVNAARGVSINVDLGDYQDEVSGIKDFFDKAGSVYSNVKSYGAASALLFEELDALNGVIAEVQEVLMNSQDRVFSNFTDASVLEVLGVGVDSVDSYRNKDFVKSATELIMQNSVTAVSNGLGEVQDAINGAFKAKGLYEGGVGAYDAIKSIKESIDSAVDSVKKIGSGALATIDGSSLRGSVDQLVKGRFRSDSEWASDLESVIFAYINGTPSQAIGRLGGPGDSFGDAVKALKDSSRGDNTQFVKNAKELYFAMRTSYEASKALLQISEMVTEAGLNVTGASLSAKERNTLIAQAAVINAVKKARPSDWRSLVEGQNVYVPFDSSSPFGLGDGLVVQAKSF